MTIIFWLCVGLILLTYLIYPILLYLATFWRKPSPREPLLSSPQTSLIIAAYNERSVIKAKILNSLAINYPCGRLEIIVVCDGSDDDTHLIAQEHSSQGILVLHKPERAGKAMALNRGVAASSGDILLFSDANNMFDPDILTNLLPHFSDGQIGGVSGSKRIFQKKGHSNSEGEGLYWKYESCLKQMESVLGSTVTADGEVFAMRRSLFVPFEKGTINDDQELMFQIVRQGFRVVYEPEARSYEEGTITIGDKFKVIARMVAGGMQAIRRFHNVIFPVTNTFAACFFVHKLLRWFVPFLLLGSLVSNLFLAGAFYRLALFAQLLLYFSAVCAWLISKSGRSPRILSIIQYFLVANIASGWGILKSLFGQQSVQWHKARR